MPDGMARISKPVAAHSAPPSIGFFLLRFPSPYHGGTDGNRTRITDATSRRVGRYTTTPLSFLVEPPGLAPGPRGCKPRTLRYATAPFRSSRDSLAGHKKTRHCRVTYSRRKQGYPTTGATPSSSLDLVSASSDHSFGFRFRHPTCALSIAGSHPMFTRRVLDVRQQQMVSKKIHEVLTT